MPGNWRSAPRPQSDRVLLTEAKHGHLTCTRDHDLNPTFAANIRITEADRAKILRWILVGVLTYEHYPLPHGFGVGRLQLTVRGSNLLDRLPAPAAAPPARRKPATR